ncbi:MAG: YfiR family protein [Acidobacteriota bacterium]|nr:YfiR family protein [Acidobacteriota bacterium]
MNWGVTDALSCEEAPPQLTLAAAVRLSFQICVLLIAFCTAASAQDSAEYAVKAAFLFHFAQLTNWPSGALVPQAPITFCSLGKDLFSGQLEIVLEGKSVQGHATSIVHLKDAGNVRSCQVLFLSQQQYDRAPAVIASLHGAPVLVVGDSDELLHQGAMISFELEEHRIRFRVNTLAAARCGISFSSTLLSLASSVVQEE